MYISDAVILILLVSLSDNTFRILTLIKPFELCTTRVPHMCVENQIIPVVQLLMIS